MKHISIMEWGYWVRFYRDRKVHSAKTFKHKDYSSPWTCRVAARKWRDENMIIPFPRNNMRGHPFKTNALGVIGVCYEERKRKTTTSRYYRAYGTSKGVSKTKRFRIDTLGHEEALRLAIKWRGNLEKKVDDAFEVGKQKYLEACSV